MVSYPSYFFYLYTLFQKPIFCLKMNIFKVKCLRIFSTFNVKIQITFQNTKVKNDFLDKNSTLRIVYFNVMIHTQLTVSVAMQTNFRFAPDRKLTKTQFREFDEFLLIYIFRFCRKLFVKRKCWRRNSLRFIW